MTIGLIDVDGHNFPNLALMKLSAWHKAQGDEVEMCFPLNRYDRIYASKVFTFTPDINFDPLTDDFRKGGTGYGLNNKLPDEVEHIMPDYSLYGITDTAYGFLTRGCPRGCDFCIVAAKEGRASRKVADLREWWNGQKNIELMDPNILACPDWCDLLGQLADSKARVNINQGTDIRLLTEAKCEALNRINIKMIHFAWDGNDDLEPLFKKFAPLLKQKDRNRRVYVLVNFNTSMEWNLHRIYTLRDCGYDPFVMVYDKPHAPREIRRLQRWCNNKFIFRSCKRFEDYNKKGIANEPQ
jgi:hypothetical protein